jgi:hypothetical protein
MAVTIRKNEKEQLIAILEDHARYGSHNTPAFSDEMDALLERLYDDL